MPNRWLATVAGLGIAIVGSALWDFAFKPLFVSLSDWLTRVGTFGFDSIRDSIYSQVSLGSTEVYGSFVANLFIGIIFSSIIIMFSFLRDLKSILNGKDRRDVFGKPTPKKIFLMQMALVAVAFYFLMSYARVVYIAESFNTLRVMQNIAAPYLSDSDRMKYSSRISLINSRSDFVSIANDLNSVLEKNGIERKILYIL